VRDSLADARIWLLLTGDRTTIAGGALLLIVAGTYGLIALDLIDVGAGSQFPAVLTSGGLGGLLTLVTLTLTINQLILSRVFGSPGGLESRFEGSVDFRRTVESVAGLRADVSDPGTFLASIGSALEYTGAAARAAVASRSTVPEGFEGYADHLVAYGRSLDRAGADSTTADVLLLILGPEYANLYNASRAYSDDESLPEDARRHAGNAAELMKGVAVSRQFYKTLVIQQDLARLSRRMAVLAFVAVPGVYWMSTVYIESSPPTTTVGESAIVPVVVALTGLLFAPLALLLSYILRVATITLYTASVGPFVPPEERFTE